MQAKISRKQDRSVGSMKTVSTVFGFSLLVVLGLALIGLFAGRPTQTYKAAQPSQPVASLALSPAPTGSGSQVFEASTAKLYNNTQYGFSFEYPANFFL